MTTAFLPGHHTWFLCVVLLLQQGISTWSWRWDPEPNNHPCTIKRWTWAQIIESFGPLGLPPLYPEPVVIIEPDEKANSYENSSLPSWSTSLSIEPNTEPQEGLDRFRYLTQRDNLLEFLGPTFAVVISSSNSLSENKQRITLAEYFSEMDQQDTLPDQLANETWYLFGETYTDDWKRLLQHYPLPLCHSCRPELVTLSFGVGNRGSGVQWHTHGPGFSQAIWGRKHWILYPPHQPPAFNKDQSSRHWMETAYWESDPKPYECTLQERDWLYFPDRWWHATINMDPYTAFVSTFTTEYGVGVSRDEL